MRPAKTRLYWQQFRGPLNVAFDPDVAFLKFLFLLTASTALLIFIDDKLFRDVLFVVGNVCVVFLFIILLTRRKMYR